MFSNDEMKHTVQVMQEDLMACRATLHEVLMHVRNQLKPEPTLDINDLRVMDALDNYLTNLHVAFVNQRIGEMQALNAAPAPAPTPQPWGAGGLTADMPKAPTQPDPIPMPPPAPPPSQPHQWGPMPGTIGEAWAEAKTEPTMPSGGGKATFASVFEEPIPDAAASAIDAEVSANLPNAPAGDPDFAAATAAFNDRLAPELETEAPKIDPDFAHLHGEMDRRTREKS